MEVLIKLQARRPEFRTRKRSQFPRVQIPNIKHDVDEVRRLMKRPPTEEVTEPFGCIICRLRGHLHFKCPCLVKIPEGVVLGPSFDAVCLGCGKIGETCCSKGAFAFRKFCVGCLSDHWFWERKCPRGYLRKSVPKLPSIDGVKSPPCPHENYISSSDEEFEYTSTGDMSEDEIDKALFLTVKDDPQNKGKDKLIPSQKASTLTVKDDLQNKGVDTLIPSQKVSTKDKDSDENYVSDEDVTYLSTTDGEMSSDDEDEEVSFPTVKDDLQNKGKDKFMARIKDSAKFEAAKIRWEKFKAHEESRRSPFKTKMEWSHTKETGPKKIKMEWSHTEEPDPKKISRPAKNSNI